MKQNTRRFNPLVGLVVAIVGLIAILGAQHIPNRHRMESDLTQRSERALRSAGLDQVEVTFTGRDGRLSADSAAEAERALGIVRALDGVRAAQAQVPPVPVPVAPPSVLLALAKGRVALSGRVPTEQSRAGLVGAAVAVFGADAVHDALAVDGTVTDAALSGLPGLLRAFGKDVNDTSVELGGGTLVLAGLLPSEASKATVLAAALDTGAVLVDRLRVAGVQQQLTSLPPVTFAFDSHTLTPAGRASLVAAGRILVANPSARIRVEGHTDSVGSAGFNLGLSRDRARTVHDFLLTQGVTADRMRIEGYGESRPKLSNASAANRSVNRRVELAVSGEAGR
ncbi:OmpA family protein [Micromonospora sp. NPDC050397]|uniref:OmpA family protein n=1 Tax=Micromonospora sp. NPDC050397 TaxID=3364279 RepID=UPI00384BC6E5